MALGVSFLIYATPISLKAGPLLPDVSGASSGWSDATANFSIPDERRLFCCLHIFRDVKRRSRFTFFFSPSSTAARPTDYVRGLTLSHSE